MKPSSPPKAKTVAVLPFLVGFKTANQKGNFFTKPFGFGFEGTPEEEITAYPMKVPQTLEEKEKAWFGSHEKIRLFVSPAAAVRMARTCSIDFHKFLKRKGWYERVVEPEAALAEIENLGMKDELRLTGWEDLMAPSNRKILKKLGLSLRADLLVAGVVNQYETDVIKRVMPISEKAAASKEITQDAIDYSYSQKLGIEVAVFDVLHGRWIWRASQNHTAQQRSADVKQDLALASASGRWNNFVKNWLVDTILENSPQEKCARDLMNIFPH